MNALELKIPPPVVALVFAAAMWLIAKTFPGIPAPGEIRYAVLAMLGLLGYGSALTGFLSFKKVKTTIDPTTPGNASSLVTSGIYRITRNPMYLGLLIILIGWGVFLSNLFALAFSACFVFYMNRFQIAQEERALEEIFGEAYTAYKGRVRRWV